MIKVRNVFIGEDVISMECLKNGLENDAFEVRMDRHTLELLPGNACNAYVYKAAAKARQFYVKTGQIPSEFTSTWF